MKGTLRYLSLLLLLLPLTAMAQVVVDVKIDSLQLFVGEQTDITLDVSMDAKQKLTLPNLKKGDEIIPNVEVVEIAKPDTQWMNDGKRMQISQRYTITAWDSSLYYLPPLQLMVDGKAYQTKNLALKVYTVDVDTVHTDRFYPPATVMDAPFVWEDWAPIFYCLLVIVLLMVLSYVLYVRQRMGKPILRIVKRKKKLPPHKVAIERITQIKSERKWAEEDSKEYYTQLTDTLRTYIQDRYHFSAMEMTSTEIIERLMQENDEEALSELREIFTTADLVKFAKYSTLINENDANLVAAMEYVNQTKQEIDPNAKPEPDPVVQENNKKMSRVWIIRLFIGLLAAISFVIFCYCAWRLWDLLW